ncbi:MAG: hypothetical protein AAF211_14995, partial [Myxococcota bacterium]
LLGHLLDAEEYLREAAQLYAEVHRPEDVGMVTAWKADVARLQGDLARAVELAKEAVDGTSEPRTRAESRRASGLVAQAEGRMSAARRDLLDALRCAEAVGNPRSAQGARLDLARFWLETDRGGEARPLIQETVEAARRSGARDVLARALALRAVAEGAEAPLREARKLVEALAYPPNSGLAQEVAWAEVAIRAAKPAGG